jgi:hypothetical protein
MKGSQSAIWPAPTKPPRRHYVKSPNVIPCAIECHG